MATLGAVVLGFARTSRRPAHPQMGPVGGGRDSLGHGRLPDPPPDTECGGCECPFSFIGRKWRRILYVVSKSSFLYQFISTGFWKGQSTINYK